LRGWHRGPRAVGRAGVGGLERIRAVRGVRLARRTVARAPTSARLLRRARRLDARRRAHRLRRAGPDPSALLRRDSQWARSAAADRADVGVGARSVDLRTTWEPPLVDDDRRYRSGSERALAGRVRRLVTHGVNAVVSLATPLGS